MTGAGFPPGTREFLSHHPLMAIRPSPPGVLRIKGKFRFVTHHPAEGTIEDAFDLQVDIPRTFPKSPPLVTEIGGKIPRIQDNHINGDGTLCLGSPLRVQSALMKEPTVIGFAQRCLIPYLFAISRKLNNGGSMAFGELAHGSPGMLDDYCAMLKLERKEAVLYAFKLLGMKKRHANKYLCPCGCDRRLGKCKTNAIIRKFRSEIGRQWFRKQYPDIADAVNGATKNKSV